jgi:hypothetical protein
MKKNFVLVLVTMMALLLTVPLFAKNAGPPGVNGCPTATILVCGYEPGGEARVIAVAEATGNVADFVYAKFAAAPFDRWKPIVVAGKYFMHETLPESYMITCFDLRNRTQALPMDQSENALGVLNE